MLRNKRNKTVVRDQPSKNSAWRKRWKGFFIAFLVSGLLTLSMKVYHTIIETQDRIWHEYASPYDTKSEFFKLSWISRARVSLAKYGLHRNNFILKSLENYSERIYQKAKAKIPENDIAWIDLLFMHKFIPLEELDSKAVSNQERDYLWTIAQPLLVGSTKIEYLDKVRRFRLIHRFLTFFTQGPIPTSSIALQRSHLIALEATRKMEINDFVSVWNGDAYIPFDLYSIKLRLGLHPLENGICWPKLVAEMKDDIHHLDVLETKLSELDKSKKSSVITNNINTYKIERNKADNLLHQKCNVNLK